MVAVAQLKVRGDRPDLFLVIIQFLSVKKF